MKRMFGLALTGVVLAMTLTGCFTDRKEAKGPSGADEPRARPAVAVVPFKSLSQSPDSGALVANAMAAEMRALGGYQVIVPGDGTGGGDADWDMDASDLGDAPYVLTGRVTSYGGKSGGGEHPTVGIAAKLVERETGNVLWSGTRTRKGSAAWFQEDSLGVLASRVCGDLAKSLDDHIGKESLLTTLAAKEPPPPSPGPDKSEPMLASASKQPPSRTKKTTAKKEPAAVAKDPASAKKETAAAKPRSEPKSAAPARQQPVEKEQAKAAPKKAASATTLSASAKRPPAQPVASDASGLAAAIIGTGGEAESAGTLGKAEEDANGFSSLRPPGNLKNGTRIVSQPVFPNGSRKASPERLRPGEREPDQVLRLTIPSQPQAALDRQYEESMYPVYDQRSAGDMM